jgi:hypothetical protein
MYNNVVRTSVKKHYTPLRLRMYDFEASSRGIRRLRVLADYSFYRDKVVVIA